MVMAAMDEDEWAIDREMENRDCNDNDGVRTTS